MNRKFRIALCLAAALSAGACSTKPRQFSAQVRPLAETAQLEGAAFSNCDEMVRKGRTSDFAIAAATTGAATAGVAGGGALAVSGLVGGGFTTAGATALAAMPIVGFAAAFGMNRMIRGGRERKYRKHMTTCLGEMGYEVAAWDRAVKKQKGTASLLPASSPATVTASTATDRPNSDSDAAQAPAVTPAPSR